MRKGMMIVILTGLVSLLLINGKIIQKEQLLEHGRIVLLELAPVDPRSIMQGDYMALRFKVGNQIRSELVNQRTGNNSLANHEGVVTVSLNQKSVGEFARLGSSQPLAADEQQLQYRVREGRVKFATNAYFFQEGTAKEYEQARYGEFRVAENGELLLTGLRDKDMNIIGSSTE